ncbi:MAG: serine hydrolase [Cyclobacteriaceae bacterium]
MPKLLFLLLLISSSAYSQSKFITLKGNIINSQTGEGIAYASIRSTANYASTISNENGSFIFKVPISNKQDTISVTHLSYYPISFVLNKSDTFLTIKLKEKINQLKEVVVKAITAEQLLQKAIANIPKNYPARPYLTTGFYRMTGRKEKQIIDISEAVFQIHNKSYTKEDKQFKLIRSRLDKDITAFNGMDGISFGTSPNGILNDDIISHINDSDIFGNEVRKDYLFDIEGTINFNGVEAYEVSFDQKDQVKKSLYKGKVIIDANNYAFLEFQIARSPKGMKYWAIKSLAMKMAMKLVNVKLKLLKTEGVITYTKFGNKYYIDHVIGRDEWYVAGGRKYFELNPLHLSSTYVITNIDTINIEFRKDATSVKNVTLETHAVDVNTDSTDRFWLDYNTIKASYNVDSAAKIIREHNSSLSLKRKLANRLRKYKIDKATKIDSILTFYSNNDQFSGTALITYKDKVIFQKAYGMADKENHIPNKMNGQFRIGSTSKQFTAMLIMQLVAENKLSLNDSVSKFIPNYRNGRVTIEQLLRHQSGIPNYTENEEYMSLILSRKYSVSELVTNFCSDPLEFNPGTQFNYSNSGYVVLAFIVEKITSKNYSDVLKEKIFEPAKMSSSFFSATHPLPMTIGYINGMPEMVYPIENTIGAGAITSTAEDLLQWNRALTAHTLLPEKETEQMFTPRVPWDEYYADYGYGWMIDKSQFVGSKKYKTEYHPGTEAGFFTMLLRRPEKGVFIVLLNNTGDFPRFDITDLILSELD